MAIIGKGVVVSGFCTMFLYTSELFPTVLRGVAIGHCGFWGRVGSLLAPQLLFLGEYTLPAVPLVIMGILGMLAGLSVLALPETLGRQLPDTVEEVEMWIRNRHQL
ncbi:Solute carrier family 22 member 6-A [Zootermopsis nevadensis]|uniref:Solute carrier family 22 member 6-A n=3 Tax=Zootermopsis nevadensis TaxID=136037 RepID=A0A067QVF4_ZOONE|nr:Solute carrier family 22 member 6-A [Zootermopsis nevadensis]